MSKQAPKVSSSHSASHEKGEKSRRNLNHNVNQTQQHQVEFNQMQIIPDTHLVNQGNGVKNRAKSPTPSDLYAGSSPDATTELTTSKLQDYSKEYLVWRVVIIEHELKKQNETCSHLQQKCHALSPLRKDFEAQRKVIANQEKKIDLLQAENALLLEKIRLFEKKTDDQKHQERMNRVRKDTKEESFHSTDHAGVGLGRPQTTQSDETVINTKIGPLIMRDSSSISSGGFTGNLTASQDFLHTPTSQNHIQKHSRGALSIRVTESHCVDDTEEADLYEVLQMVKNEAELKQKYRDLESREENELKARCRALKFKR
ncbi:unnamed protein product [Phytomonas sp. Hart1]|nr:unnamed protein product [Phytomonas sp. Hart1]|eukprot:CCW66209.1 unnamed protein product [Phytomonas sp. isolate Hart1]